MTRKFVKKKQNQSYDELIQGLLNGETTALSKIITLIESHAMRHQEEAQLILQQLLPYSGKSIRIGITGVPGAGKSTFIESLGQLLCNEGYRVAVLAVDPSSTITGGSILGHKTRMEQLSKHPQAFIRPSPSSGTLGGVHKMTQETIIACEAAGYDIIIVETVGVGQSESIVRGMVDFFMLLVITGAGDELQGMKKGIMELADAIIVNKADGDNLPLAKKTKREYNQILHFLQPATRGWKTKAHTCSSLTGAGIESIWEMIQSFLDKTKASGVFEQRRNRQLKEWFMTAIKYRLETDFFQNEEVKKCKPSIEEDVVQGKLTVPQAVERLYKVFLQ